MKIFDDERQAAEDAERRQRRDDVKPLSMTPLEPLRATSGAATPSASSTRGVGILRRGRIRRGWSFGAMSRRMGLSKPYFWRLEHGERVPNRVVAWELAGHYT